MQNWFSVNKIISVSIIRRESQSRLNFDSSKACKTLNNIRMIEKFTFFIFCFLISRISSVPQRGYQRSHYSIINVPDNNFYTGPNYQSSYQNNYRSRNGFAQRPTANVFNVPSGADGYYVIEEVDAPNQQRPQIPNRQQTGYNSYGNQQNNYQPLPNVQRPSVAPLVTQSSCSNYWTPKNEANRKWALLRLPCSGQTMNRVKLTVSIPTDLPPVSVYIKNEDNERIFLFLRHILMMSIWKRSRNGQQKTLQ